MTAAVSLDGRRVLVVAYGHVADTMAAVPALRSLRRAHPEARIEALVLRSVAPLLRRCPYVDELIVWDDFRHKGLRGARVEKAAVLAGLATRVRRRRYDAVLVLHRSVHFFTRLAGLSGAAVRAGVFNGSETYTHPAPPPAEIESSREENRRVLQAIGVTEDGGPLELWPDAEDEGWAEAFLPRSNGTPVVGLHPGSDWSCQQWLPDRWAAVGRRLQADFSARIVITGSPGERLLETEIAEALAAPPIRATGRTTLGQLVSLVRRLDVLISVNSAPAAIARAVGTPAVVLLGPEDPRLTALAVGPRLRVLAPPQRFAPGSWCEFGRWGMRSSCESPMCRGISGLDRLQPETVLAESALLLRPSTQSVWAAGADRA